MLQAEQLLQNRYQLQRQLSNNGVRQTWLALDLQANNAENQQVVVKLLAFGGTVQWDDLKLFEVCLIGLFTTKTKATGKSIVFNYGRILAVAISY